MKTSVRIIAGLAAGMGAAAAPAATYVLSYTTLVTDTTLPSVTVQATLTTGPNPNADFGDPNLLVAGISGTRTGVQIDGLDRGDLDYDSEFSPVRPYLDTGLAQIYYRIGDDAYNLYFDGNFYHENQYQAGGNPFTVTAGRIIDPANFSITAAAQPVPEPASWAMMIAGFALAGAVMRRRPATIAA